MSKALCKIKNRGKPEIWEKTNDYSVPVDMCAVRNQKENDFEMNSIVAFD